MGKQLCSALLLSLFCYLPVFGEESFPMQENIVQIEEISAFEQENIEENEKILYAGLQALEEMGSVVAEGKGGDVPSISLTQEIQAASIGQSYAELKEAAKNIAANTVLQPKQPGNRWGISLTPTEFDLLTRIVMLEAGGESPLGQQAVTEVILNRMVSPYYGGNLEHVLAAKGQFTTWKKRYSAQATPTPQVIASVNAVLQGETNILPFQTLYFSRKPQNRRIQIQIGRHTFCNQ